MNPPQHLTNLLRTENNFAILTHVDPDADGLGSSIALALALESLGKQCTLLSKDAVPAFYDFLPEHDRYLDFARFAREGRTIDEFNAALILDCGHPDRVTGAKGEAFLSEYRGTVAVIDHHATERNFGNIRWVDPAVPATGMMVFSILGELGVPLTSSMAVNLYAAISLDTGNFRFDNTSAEVLAVASKLTAAGAEPHRIFSSLYEQWSENRFHLFLSVLNTMVVYGDIAFLRITQEMFRNTGTLPDDTETFASFPRIIKNVKVSVLLREIEENYYKVSFRSAGGANMAKIAESFGGGGHMNAAGCKIRADYKTVTTRILQKIRESGNL